MNLALEAGLARRHLRPKRRRGFINLIGLIAVLGVAFSVAGVIVVVSVMNGFRQDIRDRIIGTNAHVMVNGYGRQSIPGWEELKGRIASLEGVRAVSPYYQGQLMVKSRAAVTGVLVQGILPAEHAGIGRLRGNLKKGSLEALEEPRPGARPRPGPPEPLPLLLGSELAGQLDADLGEELTLFAPVFRSTPLGQMPRMAKGRVAGIFQTGYFEYDSGLAYLRLADAQKLFEAPGQVNQLAVRARSLDEAPEVAERVEALGARGAFWVADWQRLNQNLFKALQTEKFTMFVILGCMVLVAAVNVVSTLVMVVMEKQKEIGVLRSLGFSSGGVQRVFLLQGLYIGLAGAGLGFALGLGLCAFIDSVPIKIPGGGSVYYIDTLPVQVQGQDLAWVGLITFLTCLAAATYPARQAARLDPVEAIRYE